MGARQDGEVARVAAGGQALGDRGGHAVRLVARRAVHPVLDRALQPAARPQALVEAALGLEPRRVVELDQAMGGVQDALPRAVVAGQELDLGLGEVVEEADQVLDPGAAEAVDALIVVADHGQVAALPRQQLDELELDVVGVLELVHQDVAEALLVLALEVGPLAQQAQREPDLVPEVDPAVPEQQVVIGRVGAGLLALGGRAIPRRRVVSGLGLEPGGEVEVLPRRDVLVARPVEQPEQRFQVTVRTAERQVAIEPELEQVLAQEHQDLGLVLDPELRGEAELDGVFPRQAVAEGVESGDPGAGEAIGHQHIDARFHLGGGLLGEGERQDLLGASALGGDQPGDALGQDLGLPGAGARHHEQRTVAVGDREALLVVQALEDRLDRGGDERRGGELGGRSR